MILWEIINTEAGYAIERRNGMYCLISCDYATSRNSLGKAIFTTPTFKVIAQSTNLGSTLASARLLAGMTHLEAALVQEKDNKENNA